jgi:monoamine oxidase
MIEVSRRDLLRIAGTGVASTVVSHSIGLSTQTQSGPPQRSRAARPTKVIIAGGGIAGLSCAYELMMRGHEVVLLEASGRTGGHVKTIRDPLADGLYADVGAEHFVQLPAYKLYWGYVREFGLQPLYYPHREHLTFFIKGRMYTQEDLSRPTALASFGFNQKEISYLEHHPWRDLPSLYLRPYVDSFADEYRPFDARLNHLDEITFSNLLRQDGASPAAIENFGNQGSALHVIWHAAIMKLRGIPFWHPIVYRIEGGNQRLTDALAAKLGGRIQLGAPLIAIEHGESGVRIRYREANREKVIDGDHVVCCMNAALLRQIPVRPAWPEAKAYAINTVAYDMYSRVVFQSRSAFWERDKISPNWIGADPNLSEIWRMAEEVPSSRAILVATAVNGATAEDSLNAFRRVYPGKSECIEQAIMHTWANDPWAMACETVTYRPGDLRKMWPALMEPAGRVHFAGAYTDNLNWGQEAATRSANRVTEEIDQG